MFRTITAATAIVLLACADQAAPVLPSKTDASVVIKVVDDATSENDAIELKENKVPGGNNPSMEMGADPYAGGSNDYEMKQLNGELNE